jgi:hypothetical protein
MSDTTKYVLIAAGVILVVILIGKRAKNQEAAALAAGLSVERAAPLRTTQIKKGG